MNDREQLIHLLESDTNNELIPDLIARLEQSVIVDLQSDSQYLKGVWELRWSSSSQPWLKQAPWLKNLQVLDPQKNKGVNLLGLSGMIGSVAVVAVEADLSINGINQIGVRFKKGGWIGPLMWNSWRPKLLKNINQSYPAWLDITYIDNDLRICRGNAGTCFALLKRADLDVNHWI